MTATLSRVAAPVLATAFLFLAPSVSAAQSVVFSDFEHGRADSGGVAIHYRVAGEGPTVLLIHGWPQHSLMWHTVAPLLVDEGYRVVAVDQRGAGASDIPVDGYDKATMADDMVAVLDDLGAETAHVFGYDLGAGTAVALARDHAERVEKLVVSEFGLPGFGYEAQMSPTPDWTIGSNWHLSLFTVPDAAVWLMDGREDEMLDRFFHHISYKGTSAVSDEHFELYLRNVRKPGALRAGIQYYASVWQDAKDNAPLGDDPLPMPVLAMGGEASAGAYMEQIWSPVTSDLTTYVIPKAGHWIGDENPSAVAERVIEFLGTSSEVGTPSEGG